MQDILVNELLRTAFLSILKLALPLLLTATLVGLSINILQTVFSIQEPTLSFLPKFIAVAIVLILMSNIFIREVSILTKNLLGEKLLEVIGK